MNTLGGAGVLPFAALAGLAFVQVPASFDVTLAFLAYSALILSFLGGVRWGRALASGGGAAANRTGGGAGAAPFEQPPPRLRTAAVPAQAIEAR